MRKKTFLKRTVFLLGDLFCMFGNLVSYCKGFAKNDTDLLNPKKFFYQTRPLKRIFLGMMLNLALKIN